jgi:hypothetical protein
MDGSAWTLKERCTLLISLFVITASVQAKDRPQPPHGCVSNSSGSVCISELQWTMYRAGLITAHDRISGVFENKTSDAIKEARLTFSLFDKNDRVVQPAIVTLHLMILPGESSPFRVTVEEPEGTGAFRKTLYSKEVLIETWNMSMASATVEMPFPILFAKDYKLGVRAYKKSHGLP